MKFRFFIRAILARRRTRRYASGLAHVHRLCPRKGLHRDLLRDSAGFARPSALAGLRSAPEVPPCASLSQKRCLTLNTNKLATSVFQPIHLTKSCIIDRVKGYSQRKHQKKAPHGIHAGLFYLLLKQNLFRDSLLH